MRSLLLFLGALAAGAGCSSKPTLVEPRAATYTPADIAQAALAQFDKNKNGLIEGNELDACPALKHALAVIDTNRDKALSASEIQERAERYARLGKVPVTCVVTLDGQALAAATITFEPEACMGAGLKTATTTTDEDGATSTFQVEGATLAGLAPGLYRIRVTKDGTSLPARYSTQTTLGREIVPEARQGEAQIELALTSQ